MSDIPPPWEDHITIDDDGDGKYSLNVNGATVIRIAPTHANPTSREFHFAIYGPCNIDRGIAIMKGFLHLTALLGNENRAKASQPADLENDGKQPKDRKWQTSKTTRKSKNS